MASAVPTSAIGSVPASPLRRDDLDKAVAVPSTLDSLLFLSHSQDKEKFPIQFAIDDFQFIETLAESKNSTVWLVSYRFANNLLVLKVRQLRHPISAKESRRRFRHSSDSIKRVRHCRNTLRTKCIPTKRVQRQGQQARELDKDKITQRQHTNNERQFLCLEWSPTDAPARGPVCAPRSVVGVSVL
eukprot:360617-Prorocentrum_minimum.AAC.1